MKAMDNPTGADFGAKWCSATWSFFSFLAGERGQGLMGLPIASVLCSKQLFSSPSQFCIALMHHRTERFQLTEGVDSF